MGLAAVAQAGLADCLGACNVDAKQLVCLASQLEQHHGVHLGACQVELSLLSRDDACQLLECCRALGILLIAYSPLASGRLTGYYSAANPPKGVRGFGNCPMAKVDPLIAELRAIGAAHGRSPAQV